MIGQGEDLPEFAKVKGQWISRNQMYLYRPVTPWTGSTTMSQAMERRDGSWALGFDADQLAAGLGLSVDELFNHNRAGALFPEGSASPCATQSVARREQVSYPFPG